MKKTLIFGSIALLFLSLLPGCAGKQTAVLRLTSKFENTMIYTPEEEREPEPEPVWETVTVSRGSKLMNGILTVKKVTEDTVTLQASDYFAATSYRDGSYVQQFEPGEAFILQRGGHLRIVDIALLDASHTITVVWDAD